MSRFLQKFRRDESGAITVDWVVLCAGLVAMAVAIVVAMESAALGLTTKTDTFMSAQDPN